VLLSGWWLFVPFGPQDVWFVLAGSAALVAIAVLPTALDRWRRAGSRVSRVSRLAEKKNIHRSRPTTVITSRRPTSRAVPGVDNRDVVMPVDIQQRPTRRPGLRWTALSRAFHERRSIAEARQVTVCPVRAHCSAGGTGGA
jgi:hypothetical protein